MNYLEELNKLKDNKYKDFNSKLIPNIPKDSIIGVKIPIIRNIAKKYKDKSIEIFNSLPHKYYEENIIHGFLISEIKDYDDCIIELERFLPYIDNWAVCDTLNPKVFKKNTDKLIIKVKEWIKSKNTYTIRFGIRMLMNYYLDDNFKKEYLELIANIKSEEYYINMMIAWYYATALAKQYESTIVLLETKKLNKWIHNKTIQKAIESNRIDDINKNYLKSLKMK